MANITKIYDIKLTGQKDLVSQMEKVNKEFDDARKRWKELKELVAKGGLTTGEMAKYKLEIQQTKVEIEKAKLAQQQLKNEGVSYTNALKMQREEERKSREEKKLSLDAYQKLAKELNENRRLLKAMDAENPNASQTQEYREQLRIVTELDNRIKAIDARAGQFQRNVGNYPKSVSISGIDTSAIKNLQDAGLGGVIASQINQAKSRVKELDVELITLKNQWNMVKSTGGQGLGEIEQKILDNRKAVERYNSEIKRTEKELKSVSNVGFQVTESLKKQFAGLSGQLSTFALGYLSFQTATSIGNRVYDDVVAFDSANKALEVISGTQEDIKTNQEFINRLTEQYGLKLLSNQKAFSQFYAAGKQSGFNPEDIRDIYESVISASASLKLPQEQIDGILLALSQMASKGKVSSEELRRQMGDRLPGAFGIAAKAMKMTEKDLDDMMRKGDLASKDFLPKFAKELSKAYSSGTGPVKGLQAELNRLDNIVAKIGSNKGFIAFVGNTVSLLGLMATVIGKIPFGLWLTMITLITLAYIKNIQLLIANNAQLALNVIRIGLTNGALLILNAAYQTHLILLGIVEGGYKLMIATMELMGISTIKLRQSWIAFNAMLSATPWGLVITLLLSVGVATFFYAQKTQEATVKLKEHGRVLKENVALLRVTAEINKQVADSISGQMAKISRLSAIIKDNNLSLETRKRALQELIDINPKYLNGLTLENFKTAQGTRILEAYKNKLLEVAKAKAAAALYEKKAAELFEEEFTLNDKKKAKTEADKYKNDVFDGRSWGEFAKGVGGLVGIGDGDSEDKLDKSLQKISILKDDLKELGNIVLDNKKKGINPDDPILGGGPTGIGSDDGKDGKDKPYRGSRLTGSQKDYLKDLEADKNEELAILKRKFIEGGILEDEFIRKSLAVNIAYHDKKIAYLKKGNAEERKQEAQAQLDKINDISEANDKLYSLSKKRYDDELQQLEDKAKRKKDSVDNNPYSTEQEKLDAEKNYQQESTDAFMVYTQNMLDLQIKYSKNTIEETNKLLREQQKKIDEYNKSNLNNPIQTREVNIGIIDRTADEIQNSIELVNALEKTEVIKNKNLTTEQKKLELERLSSKLELETTNATLARVIAKLTYLDSEIFAGKELTQQEWERWNLLRKQKAELEQQKAELEEIAKWSKQSASVPSSGGLQNFVKNQALGKDGKISIGKDKEGNPVDGSELLGEIIAQSFDVATQAMNNYFEAEKAAVERSKQVAYERIDLEKQQLLRTAQSAAERDSIEKQAAEKKKKADKEAGERLKKIKKQELKIALATQLANIGVAAAQNPLNGVTFGAAGIAMYAVLAGLALAQYAMNLGALNNTQFAKGGIFRRLFARGGKLKGPSHLNGGIPAIDPNTGQKVAEFEGEEGIINKNSMRDNNVYSVIGTPSQIASRINAVGGGVDWDGGATLKRFMNGGTFLGSNLRPPVFRSYFENQQNSQNNNNNSEEIAELKKMIADLAKMQKMESSKKVVLNPHDVSSYQNEYNKQTEIATL